MAEEKKFDLTADPFNTGFEVKPEITTDDVVKFFAARRSFLPDDRRPFDPEWWKATAKAAIKCGWFIAPDWKPNDIHGWPLGETHWLSDWCEEKYRVMKTIPFD